MKNIFYLLLLVFSISGYGQACTAVGKPQNKTMGLCAPDLGTTSMPVIVWDSASSSKYLKYLDWASVFAAYSTGIESVTGPTVDNTDPLNPVVGVPTLQDVTDEGNTIGDVGSGIYGQFTDSGLAYYEGDNISQQSASQFTLVNTANNKSVSFTPEEIILQTSGGATTSIKNDNVTDNYTVQMPIKPLNSVQTAAMLSDITGGGGVESVTGTAVDNTDPLNPIIDLTPIDASGDGTDITGGVITHGNLEATSLVAENSVIANNAGGASVRVGLGNVPSTTKSGVYDSDSNIPIATFENFDGSFNFANGQLIVDVSGNANFTGDLTATGNIFGANFPQDLSGYELLSNKSATTTLGTSNTLYPTQNAVKVYVDTAIAGVGSGVTSVSGTTNEITSTGGTTPVIGIASAYTTARNAYADAKVADAINNGVTTIAPSQNAVFDALALKQDALTISTGLSNTSGTVTNDFATGKAGGLTLIGGTASGDDLTIQTTSNATKGELYINPLASGATTGATFFGTSTFNPAAISGDPAHIVNIINNGTGLQGFAMYSFGTGAGFYQNNVHFNRARGTETAPTQIQAGDFGLSMGIRYYESSALGQSGAAFQNVATENQTSSAHGNRWQFETTSIGSATRKGMLSIDGTGVSVGNPTSGATTTGAVLDIWGNNTLFGSDDGLNTRTNSTSKTVRLLSKPYTNANVESVLMLAVNNSTANIRYYGGGSGSYNAATLHNWYAAANNNTATGTLMENLSTTGHFYGGSTAATAKVHIGAGSATAGTAPLKLTSGTNLTTTEAGAIEYNGTNLFYTASNSGTRYQLDRQILAGSFSGVGTATTTFTVTIGSTMANATYKVTSTPTNVLSAAVFYVTNKTTTTFDVVYLAGLTGTVEFDWHVVP